MRSDLRPSRLFDPRQFGRGRSYVPATQQGPASWANDLRLFATTFAAGFLFVSLYLA